MKKIAFSLAVFAALLLHLGAATAQVGVTWVSPTGNDSNTASNCDSAHPCQTFKAA